MALTKFRLGELERKMQKAAQALDYEAAIVIRDELRALRSQEEAQPVTIPKVVDIFTKQEVIAPEFSEESVTPGSREAIPLFVDEDAVTILEAALEEVKSGKVVGICVLKGLSDGDDNLLDIENAVSGCALEYTRMFVGGCHTLSHDLLEIEDDTADFEFSEYDEDEDQT
jgi:hypothetical protein